MSETDRHNRLYERATSLLERDRILYLTPPVALGWFVKRRVRKAIRLLNEVVELNPTNWAALWVTGKAHQALGEHDLALSCFEESREINPENADIPREASISAMECDCLVEAIEHTEAALRIRPGDAGLLANLALAQLISGDAQRARETIEKSAAADPNDAITRSLAKIVDDVVSGRRPPPRSMRDLA